MRNDEKQALIERLNRLAEALKWQNVSYAQDVCVAIGLITTPPAPSVPTEPVSRGYTLPDGYCLVKKADVLAVLRPSETSSRGFAIPIEDSIWDAGERIFKAAAPEVT